MHARRILHTAKCETTEGEYKLIYTVVYNSYVDVVALLLLVYSGFSCVTGRLQTWEDGKR